MLPKSKAYVEPPVQDGAWFGEISGVLGGPNKRLVRIEKKDTPEGCVVRLAIAFPYGISTAGGWMIQDF